jgi:hypothetical protein
VVDFALVGALLVLVLLCVVQLAVAAHVRATLVAAAAEGAREAAAADGTLAAGVRRSEQLVRASLPAAYAADVTAWYESAAGMRTAVVQVRAPLPVLGLAGPAADLAVSGHALVEPR